MTCRNMSFSVKQFVKTWMLVIAMVAGVSIYLIYHSLDFLHPAGGVLLKICTHVQPVMLFCMLFLTFCKTEPRQLRPHKWQWWLLLIQAVSFTLLSLVLVISPDFVFRVGVECLMICMICPTATACAVVTDRLGGDMAGVLTYTILINLLTALLVPLLVPLVRPMVGIDFVSAFNRILAKVFPLLIMPCLAAWLVRYLFPRIHKALLQYTSLSFYIWAVALTLAILMSTRALVKYQGSMSVLLEIIAVSILSCAVQFWAGKKIGEYYDHKALDTTQRYNRKITAGQSLGQKNTVFGIWMGYTFLDPVTSLACGFYSIWHNCYNTWQLHRAGKKL